MFSADVAHTGSQIVGPAAALVRYGARRLAAPRQTH
jgi:hypothetical protein